MDTLRRLLLILIPAVTGWTLSASAAVADTARRYRVDARSTPSAGIETRFGKQQLELLEKLNRADVAHLSRLSELVVPETWSADELAHAPLPATFRWVRTYPKFLVVHQPSQVFGAYEHGQLVRWGPVSTGRADLPTPAGLFHLNWRSKERRSTDNSEWIMRWYFNFQNRRGLSFHEFALPGGPESHACIRLLSRDARWLFDWGESWIIAPKGWPVLEQGTPVLIIGTYDFDQPPPWRSIENLKSTVVLPTGPKLLGPI